MGDAQAGQLAQRSGAIFWLRRGGLLATSAALVYLPLAAGIGVGFALGGERSGLRQSLSFTELLSQNMLAGVLAATVGLVSFGALTAVFSVVACFRNGLDMGVVIALDGASGLLAGMPHFVPETVAFVAFTAAGLRFGHGVICRALVNQVEPVGNWCVDVARLATAGVLLLLPAAGLEAINA